MPSYNIRISFKCFILASAFVGISAAMFTVFYFCANIDHSWNVSWEVPMLQKL